MKLYVWEDVLVDYSSGIMFALADSVEQARELIAGKDKLETVVEDLRKDPVVYDTPVGFAKWGGG